MRRTAALAILAEADALLEGWRCEASTECCQFGLTGREPHLTEVEWRVLADEVARQGRRLPAMPADRRCPFLRDGRCTVYAARPLGCRSYYCRRAEGPGRFPRARLAALPRRLEALSAPDRDERRGRPLSAWLAGR